MLRTGWAGRGQGGKAGSRGPVTTAKQVTHGGAGHVGDGSGDGNTRLESGNTVMTEPTGFPDRPDVGHLRKKCPQVFCPEHLRNGTAIS